MVSDNPRSDWNELEFLSWKEFKQMGPSIVQLEISRIGSLLPQLLDDSVTYNALVKTRYELKQFIQCLDQTSQPPLQESCIIHLQAAIIGISFKNRDAQDPLTKTLEYIVDRLNAVYRRIPLIY